MMKNIVCNVRMTEEERHTLKTIALKNKTTVQEVLYEAAKKYIADNIGGNDTQEASRA